MKLNVKLLMMVAVAALSCNSHADEAYAGVGFPGLTLGYSYTLSQGIKVRGEYSGGLSFGKDGKREGVSYAGNFKADRVGGYMDWFPTGSGFRVTGGLTYNDIKLQLNSNGGSGTVNGVPVNLAGEFFNVQLKYPTLTPYFGIGYGHQPTTDKGLSFFVDVGVTVGKFNTHVDTSLVGKQGITLSDVEKEAQKVRESVNKLSVLPAGAIGLGYRF